MSEINKPPRWLYWFWLFVLALGFAIEYNLPDTWDVIFIFIVTESYAYLLMAYILRLEWVYSLSQVKQSAPAPTASIIKVDGRPVIYQQVTTAPTINLERQLAFMLLARNRDGYSFNLTEAFWLPKLQCSREIFTEIKRKWTVAGLIEPETRYKNSRSIPKDWDGIRKVARGEK
jgi:hypothetical protein